MYAKGMSIRHTALLFSLNENEANALVSRSDNKVDDKIIRDANRQIEKRSVMLPRPGDILVVTVSLTQEESALLINKDEKFEDHFLEIVTQQAENTQKDIARFRSQVESGHVPSRRERRGH